MMKTLRNLFVVTLLLSSTAVMAQRTVSGTISDASGPLTGVNVVAEGTSTGTITDIDGNYTLTVDNSATALVFSYIGYRTVTEQISNRSQISIEMEEDVEQLGEIVISALGFKERRDNMGSTANVVQTQDALRSGEATFANSLAAKASNVQISASNGDPGAGTTVRIRGANTILGSSEPLIIMDGVPISNSTDYGATLGLPTIGGNDITGGTTGGVSQQSRLNDLNPQDIESITILKGAAAASLWGSRAANGVIVINTKSGQAGKVRINYKSTVSFDKVHERFSLQDIYGQGRNGSYSPTSPEAWGDYIPDRSGGADEVDQSGQFFRADDGTVYYPITQKNSRDTFVDENWNSAFQTGGYVQNDLTISGGNQNAKYFMSLGRLNQEGIIRESTYEKTNLRLNTTFTLTDWMEVTSKAGYTSSKSNRIQQSSNTAGLLLGLLRTPPDFDQRDYRGTYVDANGVEFPGRHRSYRRYLGNAANPIYNNPLWTVNEQDATSQVERFTMSSSINVQPLDWMQVILRGGVDAYTDTRVYLFPNGSGGDRVVGIYGEDLVTERQLNFDAIAKGSFNLSDDITLQTTVGWNINDRTNQFNANQLTGFPPNATLPTTDLNIANSSTQIRKRSTDIRSNRGYGVLAFGLFDQVNLNLSGAVEASSTVEDNFFYPSIDAAWKINEAIDLSSTPISFAKFRVSWGKVGVQPPAHRAQFLAEADFTYSTYSDLLDPALFGGGFRIDDDRGNPDLKPEIKTEWEIGMDFRLFDDNLSLGMTYYQNEIKDQLIPVDLTPSSGFDTQFVNGASMENKGFEADLEYSIIRNSDFDVSVYGNWSRNKNEVTQLTGTETLNLSPGASVSSRAIVGEQLGVLFGTGSLTNADGSFDLDDNGFPQITPSPIVLGDPNPDWRSGFGTRARWRNFGFNILFEHSHGGEYSPRSLWVLRRFGTTQETAGRVTLEQDLTNFDGDVIPAGTTVRGNIEDFGGGPVLLDETWYRHGIGGGFGDNQAYNFSLEDATFTRLRELSFSYTINSQAFRDRTKLSSVVITATGRNLALWDDIPGVDPQVNQIGVSNGFGLEYFTNPSTKSFLFSISITY